MSYALFVFQALFVIVAAPLTVGLVRTMKARFQNRRGASIFLPYVSLFTLLRKGMTITEYSSWVFRTVPFVVAGCSVVLAIIAPSVFFGVVPGGLDNVFVFGAFVALGSVFLVLGGMDTASTFGNMGSSREMTLAALVEPALYVSLATLALLAGNWSLGGIVAHFALAPSVAVPAASVSLVALLLVLLAENARYPVDNPATHLELTMVHEAMVLEYSGPYLALLEYASAVKLTVMVLFVSNLALPFWLSHPPVSPVALGLGLLGSICKIILGAFIIALIESTVVKMRFYRMQEYMSIALVVAFVGLGVALASTGFSAV